MNLRPSLKYTTDIDLKNTGRVKSDIDETSCICNRATEAVVLASSKSFLNFRIREPTHPSSYLFIQ